MKSPTKLQQKLLQVLQGTPALYVMPDTATPWNDLELDEVASIVQDFVNNNPEVIECDPLKDWIEEYTFFKADHKGG